MAVALPGGPPLVLPVNFALDGDVVVFRSDPGSKLDALREHPASFQVDFVDPFHRTGWSVLIQGFAYETSPADVEVDPWDGGPKAHWVRIFPGGITGRRLTLPDVELDPAATGEHRSGDRTSRSAVPRVIAMADKKNAG